MNHSEFAHSYYAATQNPFQSRPTLSESLSFDVCIIGGGFTGLNAAIELQKKGFSTVVLEAEEFAFGASGRSGGQALVGYTLGLRDLDERHGKVWGKQLWDLSTEAIDIVRERIAEFEIACDFQQGYIELALNASQEKELKSWYALKQAEYQYPVAEWWDKDKIQQTANTSRYLGGLYDPNSGHLHSLNYTLGLAEAAESLGAFLFEKSRAIQLRKNEGSHLIQTANGEIKAKYVLLACNAYLDGLNRKAQSHVLPVASFIAVTEPLGEKQPILNKMAMSDLNNCLDYFRPTADERLLFGGVNHPFNHEYPDSKARLKARMLKVFPQLSNVEMEYHWGGMFAVTRSYMPEIAHLGDDIFVAHGYTGHGVGLSNIAGRVVAEAIAGQAGRFDVLAKVKQSWIPTSTLIRKPALALAIWKAKLQDALG